MHSERFSSHDHAKMAFKGMSNMRNTLDVDNFGGVPFIAHTGRLGVNHRGTNPFKKSDFHPSETSKRCVYKEDGSGRDGYISFNNGGLSINNYSQVKGTDINQLYSDSLRSYSKDNAGIGYSRPAALRIADNFIQKQLKFEDADYGQKYPKKFQRMIEREKNPGSFDVASEFSRNSKSIKT